MSYQLFKMPYKFIQLPTIDPILEVKNPQKVKKFLLKAVGEESFEDDEINLDDYAEQIAESADLEALFDRTPVFLAKNGEKIVTMGEEIDEEIVDSLPQKGLLIDNVKTIEVLLMIDALSELYDFRFEISTIKDVKALKSGPVKEIWTLSW